LHAGRTPAKSDPATPAAGADAELPEQLAKVPLDRERAEEQLGALDVDQSGEGTVSEPRMYQLVRQPGAVAQRTCEITFLDPGVRAYVFTFG
jgi:Thioredoxin like C-terminal domain